MEYTVYFNGETTIDCDSAKQAREYAREDLSSGELDSMRMISTMTADEETACEARVPVYLKERTLIAAMYFDPGTCFMPREFQPEIWNYAHPSGGHGWVRLEVGEVPGQ